MNFSRDKRNSLEILYQDEHLVAVNKPPGLLVHRAHPADDDSPPLLQLLRDQLGQRIHPVHRLDQPTSGAIVFALHPPAAAAMVELFTRRRVIKCYQALVQGWLHLDGCIRLPLLQAEDDYSIDDRAEVHSKPASFTPQSAETGYESIRWYEAPFSISGSDSEKFSLLELQPRTGRWHQIRRHLKHLSRPIIGDYRHGDDRYNDFFREVLASDRLMLASCYLAFMHPMTGEPVVIRADRGADFNAAVEFLGPYAVTMMPSRMPPQPHSLLLER